jgi:hypothetical protein
MRRQIWRARLTEYVRLDSWLAARAMALGSIMVGLAYWTAGKSLAGLRYLSLAHRADWSPLADRFVEWFLRKPEGSRRSARYERIAAAYDSYVADFPRGKAVASLFDNPKALLGARAMVLKSAAGNEKGVLLLDYNFVLPVFAKFLTSPLSPNATGSSLSRAGAACATSTFSAPLSFHVPCMCRLWSLVTRTCWGESDRISFPSRSPATGGWTTGSSSLCPASPRTWI